MIRAWAFGLSPLARSMLPAGVIAVLVGAVYGWGIAHESLHPYYAAAARSMAGSWRAFAFGALDPRASISVDKLPGALWIQALSLRVFGMHVWALMLPQAAEGVAACLLLYRLVLRWAGAVAAATAALIFALTPAVLVASRSELPDPLFVVLSLAAARALMLSLERVGPARLLRCGCWIGAAFQVKMAQAWLLLPIFAAVYWIDGPGPRLRRRLRSCCLVLTAIGTSLFYVYALWLIPAGQRPYTDGTVDDNPFTLVFGYNALDRFGGSSGPQAAMAVAGAPANPLGWRTLLDPAYFAPQYAWFAPLALAGLAIGLRRTSRTRPVRSGAGDRSRGGYLLWGGWLAVYVVVFSTATAFHGYYTVELAPPIAALSGDAVARALRALCVGGVRPFALSLVLGVGLGWAAWLDVHHADFASWLVAVTAAAGLVALVALALSSHHRRRSPRAARIGPLLGGCCLLIAPAAWSLSALNPVYDGTPFAPMAGPVGSNHHTAVDLRRPLPYYGLSLSSGQMPAALQDYLLAHRGTSRYLLAAAGAGVAEPFLDSGAGSVLVIGGFTGLAPFPSAPAFAQLAARGDVRYAVLSGAGAVLNPTERWITAHCASVPLAPGPLQDPKEAAPATAGALLLYDCAPPVAAGQASGTAR